MARRWIADAHSRRPARQALTSENCRDVLDAARNKSTREVEHQAAALRPKPDVAPSVRKLPQPTPRPAPVSALLPTEDGAHAGAPHSVPETPAGLAPPWLPAVVKPTRARTIQGAVHRKPRDARQASPRAGSPSPRHSERRPSGHLRPGAHAARRATRKTEAFSRGSAARRSAGDRRIAALSGGCQAGGVGT
jgi:hypothetical protein